MDPERAPAPDPRTRWRSVAITMAIGVIGASLYYLSSGTIRARAWEVTIATLLVAMATGIWRFQAGKRRPWILIWCGLTLAFGGGFLMGHPELAPFDVASPSIIDAMRLSNYPLGAAGVLLLMFRADRRIGARALLEASIAVGAGSLLIWVVVIDPMSRQSEATGFARTVAFAYPMMDILLLGVMSVLVVHLSSRPGALLLVAMALAGNLGADIAFAHQNLSGGYQPGGLLDVGWLLCFAALALAPSWPLATQPKLVGDDGRLHGGRLAFLAAGALLGPAIVAVQIVRGDPLDGSVAVGAGILVALVLLRVAVFNRDLDGARLEATTLAEDLSVRNDELEQARQDQKRLNKRLHRAVEDERTRIAADLHDRPLQQLTGVGYQLERMNLLLERGDTTKAVDVCSSAADMLAAQLHEIRILMTEIRPPVLDERGLFGALEDRAHALREAVPGLTATVTGHDGRFDSEVETILYRVAQEALSNVVRHAQATEVEIHLSTDGEEAFLSIVDDGRGLGDQSMTELLRSGHFGLAGMTERVELIGGRLDIDDTVERGAALHFTVPCSLGPPAERLADAPHHPRHMESLESAR